MISSPINSLLIYRKLLVCVCLSCVVTLMKVYIRFESFLVGSLWDFKYVNIYVNRDNLPSCPNCMCFSATLLLGFQAENEWQK